MRTSSRFLFCVFGLLFCSSSFAQDKREIDSLQSLLKTNLPDTERAKVYIALSHQYWFTDHGRQMGFALKALEISRPSGYVYGMANAYNTYGFALESGGRFDDALRYYDSALTTWKRGNSIENVAKINLNIANVYNKKGDYPAAADYTIRSLKQQEQLQNKFGVAVCKLTLGNIYYSQGNLKDALQQYQEAQQMNVASANNPEFAATALSNIGSMFLEMGDYDSSLHYFHVSMDIFIGRNMESKFGTNYNNIGEVFESKGEHDSAMYYHRKALYYHQKTNRLDGVSNAYLHIGNVYYDEGKQDSALYYYQKALAIAQDIGARDDELRLYSLLSKTYEKKADLAAALDFSKKYIALYDSLHGSKQTGLIEALQKGYELEKKDQLVKIAEVEKQAADERNTRNMVLFGAAALAGLLIIGVLLMLFRTKQKHNRELAVKNNEISQQKEEITASITYAKKIQEAILPLQEDIRQSLPDSFVIWIPRDIVSGDFYWFAERNGKLFLACVDCTGHGVPGAFMSMIGNTLLNEIVLEKNEQRPDTILDLLHQHIRHSLKQDAKAGAQDGMDLAFCVLDPATSELQYAGANRPVYLVSEGQFTELLPDKQPIGGAEEDNRKPFTLKTAKLKKGDCLYLFSDGYPDQFGGDKGKKFMTRRLQELLVSLYGKEMREQQKALEENFFTWKAGHEQVDDVLIIGIRVQ